VKIKPHSNGTSTAADVPRAVNRSNTHLSRLCKPLNFLGLPHHVRHSLLIQTPSIWPTDVPLNLLELAISKDRIFFDNRLFTE
jgi:hypothetical protein